MTSRDFVEQQRNGLDGEADALPTIGFLLSSRPVSTDGTPAASSLHRAEQAQNGISRAFCPSNSVATRARRVRHSRTARRSCSRSSRGSGGFERCTTRGFWTRSRHLGESRPHARDLRGLQSPQCFRHGDWLRLSGTAIVANHGAYRQRWSTCLLNIRDEPRWPSESSRVWQPSSHRAPLVRTRCFLRESGEPPRNRTENPQIKRSPALDWRRRASLFPSSAKETIGQVVGSNPQNRLAKT